MGYLGEAPAPGGEPTAHDWGDLKTVMRNMGGMIGIRDGMGFQIGDFACRLRRLYYGGKLDLRKPAKRGNRPGLADSQNSPAHSRDQTR